MATGLVGTHIGESEHDFHGAGHQRQLTAVDRTRSRHGGCVRFQVHLLVFLSRKEGTED